MIHVLFADFCIFFMEYPYLRINIFAEMARAINYIFRLALFHHYTTSCFYKGCRLSRTTLDAPLKWSLYNEWFLNTSEIHKALF